MARSTPTNPLRSNAKLSPEVVALTVDLFGQGVGVNRAAQAASVSRKTMRGLYIALRDRLPGTEFARWHHANLLAPALVSADQQITAKIAFFDLMAACHDNEYCHRNFQAGRRKNPQCRSCPLRGNFSSQDMNDEAVSLARTVRATYAAINIGAEHHEDTVALFRRRMIHLVVVANILRASRGLPSGNLDPIQDDFLAFGTFRRVMMANLLKKPIGAAIEPSGK